MTERDSYNYQLLSRLRSDCDYYLGACAEHGVDMDAAQKHLWAGSIEAQVSKMRELYAQLPEPPEWLSADGIDRYERDMLSARDAQRGTAPVSWNDRLMVLDTVRGANGREAALLFNPGNHHTPFVVADGYDPATHRWSSGSYKSDLISAACELHGLPDPRHAVTFEYPSPAAIMERYGNAYGISPEQARQISEDIRTRLSDGLERDYDALQIESFIEEYCPSRPDNGRADAMEYIKKVDDWQLYSAERARSLFDIIADSDAVVVGTAADGITVSGVVLDGGSDDLYFEVYNERTCDVLADLTIAAARCDFLPDGYARAVTGDARAGDDTGLDLDAEMADMREVSGGMDEHEAARDADAR